MGGVEDGPVHVLEFVDVFKQLVPRLGVDSYGGLIEENDRRVLVSQVGTDIIPGRDGPYQLITRCIRRRRGSLLVHIGGRPDQVRVQR